MEEVGEADPVQNTQPAARCQLALSLSTLHQPALVNSQPWSTVSSCQHSSVSTPISTSAGAPWRPASRVRPGPAGWPGWGGVCVCGRGCGAGAWPGRRAGRCAAPSTQQPPCPRCTPAPSTWSCTSCSPSCSCSSAPRTPASGWGRGGGRDSGTGRGRTAAPGTGRGRGCRASPARGRGTCAPRRGGCGRCRGRSRTGTTSAVTTGGRGSGWAGLYVAPQVRGARPGGVHPGH